MRNNNKESRDKIYTNFASIIPTRALFDMLMDVLTTDRCCMFINNRCTSDDWRDSVKWYKAGIDTGDFIAASLDTQHFNNQRLDPNYNSDEAVLYKVFNRK